MRLHDLGTHTYIVDHPETQGKDAHSQHSFFFFHKEKYENTPYKKYDVEEVIRTFFSPVWTIEEIDRRRTKGSESREFMKSESHLLRKSDGAKSYLRKRSFELPLKYDHYRLRGKKRELRMKRKFTCEGQIRCNWKRTNRSNLVIDKIPIRHNPLTLSLSF
jgi:hypothetical protein